MVELIEYDHLFELNDDYVLRFKQGWKLLGKPKIVKGYNYSVTFYQAYTKGETTSETIQ